MNKLLYEILNVMFVQDKEKYLETNSNMLFKKTKNIDTIFIYYEKNINYMTLYKMFARKERDKEGIEITNHTYEKEQ